MRADDHNELEVDECGASTANLDMLGDERGVPRKHPVNPIAVSN